MYYNIKKCNSVFDCFKFLKIDSVSNTKVLLSTFSNKKLVSSALIIFSAIITFFKLFLLIFRNKLLKILSPNLLLFFNLILCKEYRFFNLSSYSYLLKILNLDFFLFKSPVYFYIYCSLDFFVFSSYLMVIHFCFFFQFILPKPSLFF